MGDFFVVGERYENRIGEYEVVEVNTPSVVIRYLETGRLQTVEEELQERIVRNLRRERELADQPPEERRSAPKAQRQRKKKAKFDGFVADDFSDGSGGSNWRTKAGLGGVLADLLTGRTGESLDSWAPSRQPVCYLTAPEETSSEFLADSAQFFVEASHDGLSYGLRLHRPADASEGATAWDRLLTALSEDDPVAVSLRDLLASGVAELSWYGEAWGAAEKETVRADDDGLLLERGTVTESDSVEAVIERLNEAPQDQGLILTVESSMSVHDAMSAGPGIADTIADLLDPLVALYRACRG